MSGSGGILTLQEVENTPRANSPLSAYHAERDAPFRSTSK
jgi:hypothetical protein